MNIHEFVGSVKNLFDLGTPFPSPLVVVTPVVADAVPSNHG